MQKFIKDRSSTSGVFFPLVSVRLTVVMTEDVLFEVTSRNRKHTRLIVFVMQLSLTQDGCESE